jgi:hypothetical protein
MEFFSEKPIRCRTCHLAENENIQKDCLGRELMFVMDMQS